MSDEISDYFAGSSPRKVEPLDENEMFDDLLQDAEDNPPCELESESTQELSSVAEMQSTAEQPDESTAVVASSEEDEVVEAEIENEELDVASSHWDELASALGLDPAPVKATVRQKAPAYKRTAPRKPDQPRHREESTKRHESESVEVFETESEPVEAGIPDEEVLTDLFVPRANIDFDSPIEDSIDEDSIDEDSIDEDSIDEDSINASVAEEDDLFAAFSGSRKKESPSPDESPTPEVIEDHPVVDELPPTPDSSDFVEFEVKDLKGHGDADRETGGRRRRRSGRKARTDRPAKALDSTEEPDVLCEEVTSDSEQEQGQAESRRKRSEVRDRERKPGGNRRDERRASSDRPVERVRDGTAEKKKPKIPTWDEAISGVVEKNIKRHKSNSGRGGRRRKN